jgi:hypothetical protein
MGLDLAGIRKRQNEARGGKYWKPTSGSKNHVRVFKFSHLVTEDDVTAGLFTKEKVGKSVDDFDRPVTLVYGTGESKKPVLATKEHHARYEKLAGSKKKEDRELADKIKPRRQGLLNIVDTDTRPFKMQLWQAPPGVVADLFEKVCDSDYGEAILGAEGRDYTVDYDKTRPAAKMYSISVRDQDKSPKLPAELAAKVIDFYGKPLEVVLGLEVSVEKDEDDTEAAPSKPTKPADEEADEAGDDEDDD